MNHRTRQPRRGAAGLALLMGLLMAVTACSSGTALPADPESTQTASKTPDYGMRGAVSNTGRLVYTTWEKKDDNDPPGYAIVLTDEYKLPSEFDVVIDEPDLLSGIVVGFDQGTRGLTQYQNKNIGVAVPLFTGSGSSKDTVLMLAVLGQDGSLVSSTPYKPGDDRPEPFDLVNEADSGYARVEADGGIAIPAAAAGNKDGKNYVTSVMADAFDDYVLWVMVRGSSSVYKAEVRDVD